MTLFDVACMIYLLLYIFSHYFIFFTSKFWLPLNIVLPPSLNKLGDLFDTRKTKSWHNTETISRDKYTTVRIYRWDSRESNSLCEFQLHLNFLKLFAWFNQIFDVTETRNYLYVTAISKGLFLWWSKYYFNSFWKTNKNHGYNTTKSSLFIGLFLFSAESFSTNEYQHNC